MQDYVAPILPARTILTAPINNAKNLDTIVTVVGSKDSNFVYYHIQISSDLLLKSFVIDDSLMDRPSITFKGKGHTTYYVRERARNNLGNGGWSDLIPFTIRNSLPSAFTFSAPRSGDTVRFVVGTLQVRFAPSALVDADGDSLTAFIRISGPSLDTTMTLKGNPGSLFMDSRLLKPNSKYTIEGKLTDGIDTVKATNTVTFQTPALTGVERVSIPKEYALQQNYPNPFNPSTTISYALPKSALVSVKVYNTLGQEVAKLVDEEKQAGVYQVRWNADVTSGVYYCRIVAGQYTDTKKMLLLR